MLKISLHFPDQQLFHIHHDKGDKIQMKLTVIRMVQES